MGSVSDLRSYELRCTDCKHPADAPDDARVCARCGDVLEVAYVPPASPAALKQRFLDRRSSSAAMDRSGVWRFRELLPFLQDQANVVSFAEGNTPEHRAPRAQAWSGAVDVWFKHCGLNPTGSYKDTGMTAVLSRARELGVPSVACASTGNTAASLSVYAARAGLRAIVLLPAAHVTEAKLAQTLDAGATVLAIESDFDGAMQAVRELAAQGHLYLVNSLNPFRREGQKTQAFEILEQRRWRAPDWLVLPGGNLGNCTALAKGFSEALKWGMTDRMPRLGVVQAAGAAPLVKAWEDGRSLTPVTPQTFATAIKIGNPVSWRPALRALHESHGAAVAVSDEAIAEARAVLARDGLACEPASAASLAGIRELRQRELIGEADEVVALLTGSGLKDVASIVSYHTDASHRYANQPIQTDANVDSLARIIAELPAWSG